jgi:putative hemolysin
MDPDPWLSGALGLSLLALCFIAVLSALETAVISARRSRLATLSDTVEVSAATAVIDEPDRFLGSAHLAKSLCESLVYACAGLIGLELAILAPPEPFPGSLGELLAQAWPGILLGAVTAYFAVTLLGESLSKALATRNPERILIRWAGFIRVFTLVFAPVRWLTGHAARFLTAVTGAGPALTARAAHSEEEIKLLVEGSAEEGVLEEEEKEMIHSIFEFTDTVVRQIMTPRIDIHSVSVETPLNDVVQEAMECGHSRLPVYEGTNDNVVGVIHVKDLLPYLVNGQRSISIRELMRAPFFVPEGKKIDELLQEFRSHKSQIAVVVDEFGGTSGLVTIEDVLEEIVGEIEDEYDQEVHPAAEAAPTGEGTLVDGRMPIDDVNEELGLEVPEGDYDTIGGFVFSLFGRPPEVGESVMHEDMEYVIEARDGLRIGRIRVISREREPEEASTA